MGGVGLYELFVAGIFPSNTSISTVTSVIINFVPILSLNSVQCDHMQLFTACLLHKVGINVTLIHGLLLPCRELLVCPL